ncbi:MAG TPA: TetR/AcrR family transcriptional regulator [Vicinamibacteria bacterium]|nr:TetR/AcrR family transcriptional regulator [Vicinamibacteria bacterium]
MHDRKAQILRVASELLLTRSFTSFSYQDLSDRLGIRKASIHHHFPTKDDLLVALTERYRLGQKKRLDEIDANQHTPWEKLEAYLDSITAIMESGNKICPLGSLQAELNLLPEAARDVLRQLYETPKRWLARVLAEGRSTGSMDFEGSPEERAVVLLAALQGGLQIARSQGPREFTTIIKQIKLGLMAPVGKSR